MHGDRPCFMQARALVARALCVGEDLVDGETRAFDLPAWDSMGQLSVLMEIEEALGLRIEDAAMVDQLTSVAGIASLLADHAARAADKA